MTPLALIVGLVATAPAVETVRDVARHPGPPHVHLEFPLIDAPYNFSHGGRFPSMSQSLWAATSGYELVHAALPLVANPFSDGRWERVGGIALLAVADTILLLIPPFMAWQHEEWHRAVMGRYGIDSSNDVYKFDLLASVIAVSHVNDEDLVRLKRDHPADLVRLSTAGIEGEYELAANLKNVGFFEDSRAAHYFTIPMLLLSNSLYLQTCASKEADNETLAANQADGDNVSRRDFTGLDCNGWTYDLFRPDEPYEARGIHPSGVGIDRYRTWSGLRSGEQTYLRRQYWLSWLNFADPYVFGFRRFRAGRADPAPLEWNLALRHLPTSFGYALRTDLLLRRGQIKLLASAQANVNDRRAWPGLELALFRYPLLGSRLVLSNRAALWLQPSQQRFTATGATPGGLASARLGWRWAHSLEYYVEIEGKTPGWVAGNVYLDANLSVRTGVVLPLWGGG